MTLQLVVTLLGSNGGRSYVAKQGWRAVLRYFAIMAGATVEIFVFFTREFQERKRK
jgi:hypothetical protein